MTSFRSSGGSAERLGSSGFVRGEPRSRAGPGRAAFDCALLVLAALAVRCIRLGHEPLWVDEGFSVGWTQLGIRFMAGAGRHLESNPPGYYVLLRLWTEITGSSDTVVRLPSAVCSAATAAFVYLLGRRAMGRRAGLLAALMFIVDPFSLYLAQEARSYALLGLLEAAMLLPLVSALDRRHPGDAGRGALIAYTLLASAAVYVHFTAVLFVGACFVAVAFDLLVSGTALTRRIVPWVASGVAFSVLVALPLRDAAGLAHSSNIAWIAPTSLGGFRSFAEEIATYPFFEWRRTENLVAGVLAGLVLLGLARRMPRGEALLLGIVVPGSFIALMLGLSLRVPVLLSRVAVGVVPSLCLLLTHSVLTQPTAWRRRLVGGLALLTLAGTSGVYFAWHRKEDWRDAAQIVASDRRCDGPILTWGPFDLDLLRYAPSLGRRPLYEVDSPEFKGAAAVGLNERLTHATPLPPEQVAPFLDAHDGAVLVSTGFFAGERRSAVAAMTRSFAVHRALPGSLSLFCR